MNFIDTVEIVDKPRKREDGAMIVDTRVARTGIQHYAGFEVGRPDLATVRVFRSAKEVFDKTSLATFAHRPVTNDHPPEAVTADNWKKYAVGQTADEVLAESRYIRVPLMVSDAAAIADIEAGKRELSCGYVCDLSWKGGQTESGETFDAEQTNIRINHIAIVRHGRAGSEVRIGDSANAVWGVMPLTNDDQNRETLLMTTKTMIVDGLPILVTDQAESMINKLQGTIATLQASAAKMTADHAVALAAKDVTIGEKTAENAKLADAAIKPADLDKMIADRAELITVAKTIVTDLNPTGMTDAAIRAAVVKAKMGDDAIKDQSEAVIDGMFRVISKDANKSADPFAAAFADRQTPSQVTNDHGQTKYEDRIRNAWKDEKAAA